MQVVEIEQRTSYATNSVQGPGEGKNRDGMIILTSSSRKSQSGRPHDTSLWTSNKENVRKTTHNYNFTSLLSLQKYQYPYNVRAFTPQGRGNRVQYMSQNSSYWLRAAVNIQWMLPLPTNTAATLHCQHPHVDWCNSKWQLQAITKIKDIAPPTGKRHIFNKHSIY